MEDYSQIQKPELGYTYEFEVGQLDLMSECLDAHGFCNHQRHLARSAG